MLDYLQKVLIAVLIVFIVGGIAWLSRRSKPLSLGEDEGAIRPGRGSAWFTVGVGGLMFLIALWALVFSHGGVVAVLLALLGAAIAGFMAPSITSVHKVSWNQVAIEGPSRLFGPTLGRGRTSIAWSDIVTTGATRTGYWYVESNDGRRVYWSYLYPGYGALTAVLRQRCPGLLLYFDHE